MRIVIVPADGMMGIDGDFRHISGLPAMFPLVHAVQWYGEQGEVEFTDGTPNEPITDIAAIQAAVDAWNLLTPPPPTAAELLAAAKETQISTIEAAYTAAVSADIAFLSTTFQADTASQALISSVLVASGGALPAGFVWYDATNQPVVMTYAELQGLAGSILMRGQPLFGQKQTHKAAIRAATTIAQVEAVVW